MALLFSYEHNGVKDEFAETVANIAPKDFIFQSMIGMKKIENRLHNWQVDFDEPASENAYKEGMKWSEVAGTEQPTVVLKNHCQKMAVAIEMTTESQMQSYWASGDIFDRESEKKLRKLKRDREVSYLTNGKYVIADDKNNIPGKTGGFASMVSSIDGGITITPDPLSGEVTYFEAAGDTPTEDEILTALAALWITGAHPEVIMVNNTMAPTISAMQEEGAARLKVFDGETDKGINFEVNTITDPLGQTVKIIYNRYMPSGTVYIFNSQDWQRAVFRAPDTEDTPKDGDYDKKVIVSDESLEHRNPWCSAVIVPKRVLAAVITDAGYSQVSVNGGSWLTYFPDGSLIAGSPVDFEVRIRSDQMTDPDDGSYEYDFKLTGASGGLSLVNTSRTVAHITGTTPADQAGLTLNVTCTVIDSAGNSADSDILSGDWGQPEVQQSEPEVQQGEPEVQQSEPEATSAKKSKSTK